MFHQTDEGIRPSIIDPHGFHLADAAAKLKGLADYAAEHCGGLRSDRCGSRDRQEVARIRPQV